MSNVSARDLVIEQPWGAAPRLLFRGKAKLTVRILKSCQNSKNRRLLEYQRRRVWQKIVAALMKLAHRKGKINLNNAYHDASVVKWCAVSSGLVSGVQMVSS
jgi:hypothetical protein